MRQIRYLDKLIDELAKGKAMEKDPEEIACRPTEPAYLSANGPNHAGDGQWMAKSRQLKRSFAIRQPVRRSTCLASPTSTRQPARRPRGPSRSGKTWFRRARVRHRIPMPVRMK